MTKHREIAEKAYREGYRAGYRDGVQTGRNLQEQTPPRPVGGTCPKTGRPAHACDCECCGM